MRASRDVVFVTYNGLPDGDPDDLQVLNLLRAQGFGTTVVDWRKTAAQAISNCLVVLRSTWDYHQYCQQFLDWVDAVANLSEVQNEPRLIRWNVNKKYLLDLQSYGLAIVPTLYISGEEVQNLDLPHLQKRLNHLSPASALDLNFDWIVKPAIGLSTYGVKRFTNARVPENSTATGDQFLQNILDHMLSFAAGASGDVLVQPYLSAVENYGERSLVFIDGKFSHSVRKSAFQKMAAAGLAGETSVTASASEIAFGKKVLAALVKNKCDQPPLYARIDVVPDESGAPLLLELELMEPSLFLAMAEGAPQRLATAIATRASLLTASDG